MVLVNGFKKRSQIKAIFYSIFAVAVQARDDIRSELRAPRDKNNKLQMGTSHASNYGTPFTFVPCNESPVLSNEDEGNNCDFGASESVEEDSGCCMPGSGIHWRPTFATQPSGTSEGEEEGGGDLNEEDENFDLESGDEEESGQLSLERCV